jgi:hypothetical protein
VRVAAQRPDRGGVAVGGRDVRVDLEDVAVVALRAVLALPELGLLAAQPGAPRRDAARAVRRRAGESDDLAQPGALRVGLHDRGAARDGGVVGEAVERRNGVLGVGERLADLMVDDQQRAAAPREGTGAVVEPGCGFAGLQAGAPGGGHQPVGEPGGQREEAVGVVAQWPVARHDGCGGRVRSREQHLPGPGEHDPGGGACQEAPAGQHRQFGHAPSAPDDGAVPWQNGPRVPRSAQRCHRSGQRRRITRPDRTTGHDPRERRRKAVSTAVRRPTR